MMNSIVSFFRVDRLGAFGVRPYRDPALVGRPRSRVHPGPAAAHVAAHAAIGAAGADSVARRSRTSDQGRSAVSSRTRGDVAVRRVSSNARSITAVANWLRSRLLIASTRPTGTSVVCRYFMYSVSKVTELVSTTGEFTKRFIKNVPGDVETFLEAAGAPYGPCNRGRL